MVFVGSEYSFCYLCLNLNGAHHTIVWGCAQILQIFFADCSKWGSLRKRGALFCDLLTYLFHFQTHQEASQFLGNSSTNIKALLFALILKNNKILEGQLKDSKDTFSMATLFSCELA